MSFEMTGKVVTRDNRDAIYIDSYRYGTVTVKEALRLDEERVEQAWQQLARNPDKPIIQRINVGIYEVFALGGRFNISHEVDDYGQQTGWWIVKREDPVDEGWWMTLDEVFPTLREAKQWCIAFDVEVG